MRGPDVDRGRAFLNRCRRVGWSICAIGGSGLQDDLEGAKAFWAVYRYDPATGGWDPLPPIYGPGDADTSGS